MKKKPTTFNALKQPQDRQTQPFTHREVVANQTTCVAIRAVRAIIARRLPEAK